jgi:hypothetical protein
MNPRETRWRERGGSGSSGSGQDPVVGCCEHGNEPSGSTGDSEFLD